MSFSKTTMFHGGSYEHDTHARTGIFWSPQTLYFSQIFTHTKPTETQMSYTSHDSSV